MPTKNKKNKNNNKFLSGEELRITREGSSKVQRWHVSQELEGMPIAGREIDYFDTPGDGDMDVTPMDLLALIEQELRDRAVLVNKILVGPRDGFVDVNKTMSDVRMTGHWTTVCQTKKE